MKNNRTRIKVCGITTVEDAQLAVNCGVDAIGLVFYDNSPRAVDVEQARKIINSLPAFVSCVGLFVDASAAQVQATLSSLSLDLLQFHGNEDEAYCASFSRPYLKALKVKPELDLPTVIASFHSAKGILLDAWHPTIAGGTGECFDWELLSQLDKKQRIILAGGLTPKNVKQAIQQVEPYAIDVSSGVEVSPGIKSEVKIHNFVEEVRGV